jgi:hypothetical protein
MSTSNSTLPDTTGLTFEKVWAMSQETDKQIKELAKQSKGNYLFFCPLN